MKDPAILFYTSDFITGTLTMTDAQRGKYIILLCLQHQQGYLDEQDMLNICKTYDEKIFSKFEKDSMGYYYNKRMLFESEKRNKYSESRRNNRLQKDNICKTYDKHMENENENINIIEEKVSNFENFRKQYPGTKRGYEIEFSNFKKKHKDWKDILPTLKTALEYQINIRNKKKEQGKFVPEWKNLQTWINQRCWEEEIGEEKIIPSFGKPGVKLENLR